MRAASEPLQLGLIAHTRHRTSPGTALKKRSEIGVLASVPVAMTTICRGRRTRIQEGREGRGRPRGRCECASPRK